MEDFFMRKKSLLLVCLTVLALLVSSYAPQAMAQDVTLTVAISGDAITMDPTLSNDNQSSTLMLQIYEGLVELDPAKNEIIPALAEKWEMKDEKTYVFYLKKGIKFHNGEELKASDVVFSLKRACVAPNVLHLFDSIDPESITAVDDYTVQFTQKYEYAGIVAALCHSGAFICNEKAVTEAGDKYPQNPVGTGAVKFVSWSKANNIVLERYEDYHGTKTQYKQLIYRVIPEPITRLIELESGGVDIAFDVAPIDIKKVEANPDLAMYTSFDYGTTYLGFNTQKAPFDNAKVREAISYALDTDAIIKAVYLGVGRTATGPMPPTLQYSIAEQLQLRAQDVEKAKALLTEAGFPDGFSASISTNDNQARIRMATIMQGFLAQIGVKVEINVLEWSAYNDHLKNAEQDMFMISWGADSSDPDTFMYPCFHSSAKGAGGNYVYLEDKELDDMLDAARVETDSAKRGELYKQAQERVMEINAWVPLYNAQISAAARANIQGFVLSPFNWHLLRNVTK